MCKYKNHRIAAREYLSAAKRRNKHLKKLKSVSRAYRKGEVRGLKARAHEANQKAEYQEAQQRHEYENRQHLQNVHISGPRRNGWMGL